MKKSLLIFLLIFFILTDQFSKYLIRHSGGFYICNYNMIFGLEIPRIIFWPAWLFIATGTLYLLFFSKSEASNFLFLSYALILAGALSNIFDRLFLECIIDFIDLKFWTDSIATQSVAGWPVFNLADMFISGGVLLILANYLKKTRS